METSASFEARSAPSSYPTRHAVSSLRHSPGRCANSARVVAMRAAHRHRRALKWWAAARHFDFLSMGAVERRIYSHTNSVRSWFLIPSGNPLVTEGDKCHGP